jgi:hypothetical protein
MYRNFTDFINAIEMVIAILFVGVCLGLCEHLGITFTQVSKQYMVTSEKLWNILYK